MKQFALVVFGGLFGTVLILAGATSWQVMNDMFHFRSFQMFGVIGSAIATASLGTLLMRRLKPKSLSGEQINFVRKPAVLSRNGIGGLLFGLGWGITGACTAPIFLRIGDTPIVGSIMILSALTGAGVYVFIFKRK